MKKGEGKRASKFPPLSEWEKLPYGYELKANGFIYSIVSMNAGWTAEVYCEDDAGVYWSSRTRARPRDVLAELRSNKDFGDRAK